MRGKRADANIELMVGIVVLLLVAGVVAWGFITDWKIFKGAKQTYAGSDLIRVAQTCQLSCSPAAAATTGWCTAINTLSELEDAQLFDICNKITANTDGCTKARADKTSVTGDKAGYKAHSVDFKQKTAKTTCSVLGEANLIVKCDDIKTCPVA